MDFIGPTEGVYAFLRLLGCPCVSVRVCQMIGLYISQVLEKSQSNILKNKAADILV